MSNSEELKMMTSQSSPSGFESEVPLSFRDAISQYVDEVSEDNMGNVVGRKKGQTDKTLMFVAHMDEVGLMITYIDERGFLYFKPIGAIDVSLLPGLRVVVKGKSENYIGVIGRKPIHLQGASAGEKVSLEELWIDIGISNKEEVLKLLEIGTCATFASSMIQFGNSDFVTSKALDDRVGLHILCEVAKRIKSLQTPYNVFFVGSVQEELGFRGAEVVANSVKPEIAVVIDVTHATDYPSCSPIKDGDIKLGEGPVITTSPNVDKLLNKTLKRIAEPNGIPYQIECQPYPSGTDGRVIQTSGQGVRTALLSIPCRYMHSPVEVVSLRDVDSAINLLTSFVSQFTYQCFNILEE